MRQTRHAAQYNKGTVIHEFKNSHGITVLFFPFFVCILIYTYSILPYISLAK